MRETHKHQFEGFSIIKLMIRQFVCAYIQLFSEIGKHGNTGYKLNKSTKKVPTTKWKSFWIFFFCLSKRCGKKTITTSHLDIFKAESIFFSSLVRTHSFDRLSLLSLLYIKLKLKDITRKVFECGSFGIFHTNTGADPVETTNIRSAHISLSLSCFRLEQLSTHNEHCANGISLCVNTQNESTTNVVKKKQKRKNLTRLKGHRSKLKRRLMANGLHGILSQWMFLCVFW